MWHLVRMSVMSRFTKSDVSFPFVFEMAVSGPFLPFQGFLHRETRTRYLVQLFPNSNHILQTDGWHNVIFLLSLFVGGRGNKNRHCAKKHEFLTSSLQNSAPKVSVTVTAWDLVGLSIRKRATKMSQGAMPAKQTGSHPFWFEAAIKGPFWPIPGLLQRQICQQWSKSWSYPGSEFSLFFQ